MDGSNSSLRGAAAGGGARGGRSGCAVKTEIATDLSRSVSPKPSAAGQALVEPQRIEPISMKGLSKDFQQYTNLANGFIHVFNTVHSMIENGDLTAAQAATILRAQIARSLERCDCATKYRKQKLFAPLAMKILSQLQTLGKRHNFSHAELQYFVLMCAPSAEVFEKFQSDFLTTLAGMEANARTFCLLFWIAVMTMSNVPHKQEDLEAFYAWYNATINRQDTPSISRELAAIFTSMQNKVQIAFDAIGDEPNKDPSARRQARQKLGLPPSENDQDDDGASANSGYSAASASSTMSAGGTRRDALWRFRAAIMCLKTVFEHLSIQSEKHAFFASMSTEQLDELVRGLMKKTTCRSSGPRSHNAFGRKIREILLRLVNQYKQKFRLCIPKTTTSIMLATGSVQAGLDWHTRASSVEMESNQNRCICSALIMFDLGINGSLQNQANVKPILDAAFGSGEITLPQGKFAKLAQSAAEKASQDLKSAISGKWRSVSEDCDVSSHSEEDGRSGSDQCGYLRSRGRSGGAANSSNGARGGDTSSELTAENVAALQARIRALEMQLNTRK
jgi:hypothetical protein